MVTWAEEYPAIHISLAFQWSHQILFPPNQKFQISLSWASRVNSSQETPFESRHQDRQLAQWGKVHPLLLWCKLSQLHKHLQPSCMMIRLMWLDPNPVSQLTWVGSQDQYRHPQCCSWRRWHKGRCQSQCPTWRRWPPPPRSSYPQPASCGDRRQIPQP